MWQIEEGDASAVAPAHAPAVLASAATGLVGFIERQGGDVDDIFGNAGIAPDMAGEPTLKLSLNAYCGLFEEAATRTQNGNFGLWFGQQFEPRDLGLWGYAAVSAPTLGSALETLVELFPYHQESSVMRLERTRDGLVRLEYQIEAPAILDRRQDAELSLGMFRNLMRECLGPACPLEEVHFEHPEPESWREHENAFAAPVFFSRPTNALVFRSELMARPMPARDPRLMATMRSCLEQLSRRHDAPASLGQRVRTAIRALLASGYPQLEDVAARLRLSPGTIQRELAAEGHSYRELVEETRRDLAFAYMRQRQLPLSEIAFLLGYSELSAFSRAVRRWTGESPRTVRTRLWSS
ncbi:MAG: AraC family transcriptional regulator [Hyphomicrobiaceae bacterium]